MFGIPWTYIAIALAFVGVIAGGYFAVQHYNSVVAENVELKVKNSSLQAEKDQIQQDYQNIASVVDKNSKAQTQVETKTNTIVREIHDAPVTTNCVNSPSVGIALQRLRENQTQ